MLKAINNQVYEHVIRFEVKISNNEAKYEALLSGLRYSRTPNVRAGNI